MEGIFVALGSNLGNREKNLQDAKELLQLEITQQSSIYETEPVEYFDQPWFLNSVIALRTDSTPIELLRHCQEVERRLGRRREISKGPRTMDLDILFFNQTILKSSDLTIPHPGIPVRRFVLEPLHEIAPQFVHPILQKTVSQLLEECSDRSIVKKL